MSTFEKSRPLISNEIVCMIELLCSEYVYMFIYNNLPT